MNKERRKKIGKAIEALEEIKEIIEILKDEEQEYFDNMPDNLRESEKGNRAEEDVGSLESAEDSLQSSIEYLLEIE